MTLLVFSEGKVERCLVKIESVLIDLQRFWGLFIILDNAMRAATTYTLKFKKAIFPGRYFFKFQWLPSVS